MFISYTRVYNLTIKLWVFLCKYESHTMQNKLKYSHRYAIIAMVAADVRPDCNANDVPIIKSHG